MKFFESCWELAVRLLDLATLAPWSDRLADQQPLSGAVVQPPRGSPGFQCHYPKLTGWESCNTPNSRDCWLRDPHDRQPLFKQYDINTDYEFVAPEGITREYWLTVDDFAIHPDGFLKTQGKVFNNTYPGPLIEACWGDELVIHVKNNIQSNGTTIHWHGLRQLHTTEMDGVNGVTQCPIATGDEFTYKFRVQQYGHTWYHSHYSLQYPDGLAGPLLLHGPTSANWDVEWTPILVNDWSHDSAFEDFQLELTGPPLPVMQTILLNGTGNWTCQPTDDQSLCNKGSSIFTKTFQRGKRYLLRLINASTESTFVFSIDGHKLQVVSNDLVSIQPFETESILIGIGQRYSVIVEANAQSAQDGNYWIRTQLAFGSPTLPTVACGTIQQNASERGIIRYDPKSTALPTTDAQPNISTSCEDEPFTSLVPVVPWNVGTNPANNVTLNTYEAGIDKEIAHDFHRWELTDDPLWLDFADPTIVNLRNTTFNPEYAIVDADYDDQWVYLIITGNSSRFNTTRTTVAAAHPIQLHGHDFAILGQSNEQYDVTTSPLTFNYNNPPRRDVALLPADGYLAIAFKTDNPGVWLLHCHIAWHASSGLALQILERQPDILKTIGPLDATQQTCHGWDNWLKTNILDQNDSGV